MMAARSLLGSRSHRAALLVALGLTAGWLGTARAYPIPPVTLWELVEKSDLIVLATVQKTEEPAPQGEGERSWNDSVAKLSVMETWKGRGAAALDVPFLAGMLCPAPPRYEVGLPVLAFLKRGADGQLSTVGLSYGTLYPEPKEVAPFRELVSAALAAQRHGVPSSAQVGKDRERARVEWLVRAATHPATRWHGVYELAPASDALHAFYDKPRPSRRLTEADMDALARALVTTPVLDATFPMMLKVLAQHRSREVDAVAVAAADTLLELTRPPYWLYDVVELTLGRLGRPPVPETRPVDRGGSIEADPLLGGLGFDFAAVRRHWTDLRKKLDFPRRILELPSLSGVPRTGPSTPP